MNVRKPVVAGTFYPSNDKGLISLLHSIYKSEKEKIDPFPDNCKVIGAIVPHAGYVYSGYEATHFFASLASYENKIDTVVILNPDHSGLGNKAAVDDHEAWETPLGIVELDIDFIEHLNLENSSIPHRDEHASEVMLPFLQYYLNYPFKIVPISITEQTTDVAIKLASDILNANEKAKRNLIIIASSDFSHYVHPSVGYELDTLAVKEILNLDSLKFNAVLKQNQISVCGYCPIMTLIEYSKLVCEKPKTKVLVRGNSGKAGNDFRVVDYNTILFYE